MAYNEFDASWPKPKTYVEAGVCSQRVFDMVNQSLVARDGEFEEVIDDGKIRNILTACDWDLPSAMAMLLVQCPKAEDIANMTEQASRVLKIRMLMTEAENVTHNGRKAQELALRAENRAVEAREEAMKLRDLAEKACQLAMETTKRAKKGVAELEKGLGAAA